MASIKTKFTVGLFIAIGLAITIIAIIWLGMSKYLIPLVATGYIFFYVGTSYAAVFQLAKRTKYVTYGYALGAGVNILGNLCLVPTMGIVGAALVTMVSYLGAMVYFVARSRSLFRPELEWGYVVKAVLAGLVMHVALEAVIPALAGTGSVLRLGVPVVFGAGLYGLGVLALGAVTREELSYVWRLVREW